MFGNPETTTGGNVWNFMLYSFGHSPTGAIKIGDAVVGNETRIKGGKNKVLHRLKKWMWN